MIYFLAESFSNTIWSMGLGKGAPRGCYERACPMGDCGKGFQLKQRTITGIDEVNARKNNGNIRQLSRHEFLLWSQRAIVPAGIHTLAKNGLKLSPHQPRNDIFDDIYPEWSRRKEVVSPFIQEHTICILAIKEGRLERGM